MRLIEWYVLRRIAIAFAAVLFVLTAIIWATQALQRLDLVTAKGQTLGLFLELTVLAVPFLATLIAPIAFVIAMVVVYDALNRDNELAVMAAAGASRVRLLRPALAAAVAVALFVALLAVWLAPLGLKAVRILLTEVRADIVGSVVRPGSFMEVDDGLVVHIDDRLVDGSLAGLLLADGRGEDLEMTYFARLGRVVEAVDRTLLVMSDGTVHRLDRATGELSVVAYEAYAFDLSNLVPEDVTPVFKPSERTLAELAAPPAGDAYATERAAAFRVELHDRLSQPLYPIAFALIAFLFVGDPRTNRQDRTSAVLATTLAVGAVRFAGYGAATAALATPAAIALLYAIPVAAGGLAAAVVLSDRTVTVHDRIGSAIARAVERLAARMRAGRRRLAPGRT